MLGRTVRKSFEERDVQSSVAKLTVAKIRGCSIPAPGVENRSRAGDPLAGENDLQNLVARIYRGEDSGMEDLYKIFGQGIQFYLCRQLGPQELDDKIHDTLVIVVQAIRKGEVPGSIGTEVAQNTF